MIHIPTTTPRMMESLRRRDLIIVTSLLIPGIVSGHRVHIRAVNLAKRLTEDARYSCVDTRERCSLVVEFRTRLVCLSIVWSAGECASVYVSRTPRFGQSFGVNYRFCLAPPIMNLPQRTCRR